MADPPNVALREYIEAQLDALERRLTLRADLEQLAVKKAEEAMLIRLDGMNEIRAAMRDQTGQFVTRDTYETKHDTMVARVHLLETRVANLDGRAAIFSAIIALVVSALVTWFVKH